MSIKKGKLFFICLIITMVFIVTFNVKILTSSTLSEPYIFITQWGNYGKEAGHFIRPEEIIIDSKGNVYVLDLNNRIQKFDSSGKLITQWGDKGSDKEQFNGPGGIAIDMEDYIYVSDCLNNRIQKFDSSGKLITQWGDKGSDKEQLNGPGGIAVDFEGNIFVTDRNSYIKKFDLSGNFISNLFLEGNFKNGTLGDFSGFTNIITTDFKGNLYLIYSAQSYNLSDINSGTSISLLELASKSIFISYIVKYNSSGNFITKWGSYGNK